MRILIIDDNYLVLDSLASFLNRCGHDVWALNDSSRAFDILSELEGELDVVLSDIWMPRIDGIEILKGIRSLYPEVRVVMMTGFRRQTDFDRVTSLGARSFIQKPVKLFELEDILKEIEDEKRSSGEVIYENEHTNPKIHCLTDTKLFPSVDFRRERNHADISS